MFSYYYSDLFSCAKSGSVDIIVFRLETVESPDKCQFEIAGHVSYFHAVVLASMVDAHSRRPCVEYVIGFQVKFTAMLLSELPFNSGIDFPH